MRKREWCYRSSRGHENSTVDASIVTEHSHDGMGMKVISEQNVHENLHRALRHEIDAHTLSREEHNITHDNNQHTNKKQTTCHIYNPKKAKRITNIQDKTNRRGGHKNERTD